VLVLVLVVLAPPCPVVLAPPVPVAEELCALVAPPAPVGRSDSHWALMLQ